MKFHNGCWLLKEGVACFSPQQAYNIRKTQDSVEIFAPTKKILHKGNTLDNICLTIHVTAPMPEILRVQIWHHKGVQKKHAQFELNLQAHSYLEVEDQEKQIIISSGSLCLIIDKVNWSMTYQRNGEFITQSAPRDLAYMKGDWHGNAYDVGKEDQAYMLQQLQLSVGELIYGLGERFAPFVKNGQSITIWNDDAGTNTDGSYKNIPFYLSNRGYGIFVNHPEKVEFEIGTEQVAKVAFSVPGEKLDYFFINGPTMKDVLIHYTDLTGKPAKPPLWSFGLWLSTSFTTNYDETTVMHFIDGMKQCDIPLSVFHFDCFWMQEFHWTDFTWNKDIFPDPKGMLQRIKEKGIHICVWINPYIAQESSLFNDAMERGYFLKKENGDIWQWDMWQPGLAIVDFTNPDACQWYQSHIKKLLDIGVDCLKTDFGERIPTNVIYSNGADPQSMHNYYAYLYNKTVYEVLSKEKGIKNAILFSRSATVGSQKFPVHWGGDCWSDYTSMEQSLRGGLSLTSSGFGFWSHDIGGFESQSTPDIYKRWVAFGLLSTHSRLHGSSSYRVPWNYDDEAIDVLRFFTKLKLQLLPYLYTSASNTSLTGVPLMRSMVLEFEYDRNCCYLDKQYMLGDNLLVSPIFNEQGVAEYYLPSGIWTNYLTGEIAEGGAWRKEYHDYLSIPLWVRQNSVIPTAINCRIADQAINAPLEWKVFSLNKHAQGLLVKEDGTQNRLSLETKYDESGNEFLQIATVGTDDFRIRFVNTLFEAELNEKVSTITVMQEGRDTLIVIPTGEIRNFKIKKI